jgi:hypothetical protein
MFKNQAEYDQFRAWVYEGSCLAQRMSLSVEGGKFDIPPHWKRFKKLDREWPHQLPAEFMDRNGS